MGLSSFKNTAKSVGMVLLFQIMRTGHIHIPIGIVYECGASCARQPLLCQDTLGTTSAAGKDELEAIYIITSGVM